MKTNRTTALFATAGVVGLLAVSGSQAAITLTLQDTPYNNTSNGGGEFAAYVTGASLLGNYASVATYAGGFSTFCLEYSEHIGYGVPYNTTIGNAATLGGVTGGPSDRISAGTAWLYYQFGKGTLSGYNYGTTGSALTAHNASSKLLQEAIWFLEGEIGPVTGTYHNSTPYNGYTYSTGSNAFIDAAVTQFGSLANAQAADSVGLVLALNPTDTNGNPLQSQLAIVPETSTIVAGALLLLPFGASTIRILRKNRTV